MLDWLDHLPRWLRNAVYAIIFIYLIGGFIAPLFVYREIIFGTWF